MRVHRWVLALFLAIMPTGVYANVTQDNFLVKNTVDLLDLCSASQSDPLYAAAIHFCEGFAVGVYRVLDEEEAARPYRRLFCLPEPQPTRNEAIAAFVQWAKAAPGQAEERPADSIARFLSQQYPCRGASMTGTGR
jgi:hypothetical protein